jgi:hypothetical protein
MNPKALLAVELIVNFKLMSLHFSHTVIILELLFRIAISNIRVFISNSPLSNPDNYFSRHTGDSGSNPCRGVLELTGKKNGAACRQIQY